MPFQNLEDFAVTDAPCTPSNSSTCTWVKHQHQQVGAPLFVIFLSQILFPTKTYVVSCRSSTHCAWSSQLVTHLWWRPSASGLFWLQWSAVWRCPNTCGNIKSFEEMTSMFCSALSVIVSASLVFEEQSTKSSDPLQTEKVYLAKVQVFWFIMFHLHVL